MEDISRYVTLFQMSLGVMNLPAQTRLPLGSYVKGGPMPNGIVYEDIMGVLMRLFRLSYLKSRGMTVQG